jgi:hypothetical protein
MKLLSLFESPRKCKKYVATFDDGKKIHFGAKGYEDYTLHKDDERKMKYIKRHRKRENWLDPISPGTLSRYLLWNKKTLIESIKDYKKRFNV